MKLSKTSLAVFVSIYSSASFANDNTTVLGEIFVSETPLLSNDIRTAYSIESFTEEDIKSSGTVSLSQFLNQKTTVSVQPNFGNPLAPKLDMNGFGTNGGENIQVIVDGISINNIDLVPQQLSSINLNQIKEIQILRGSGAVLYGNGAVAGAIIINTKKPSINASSASASISYGSNQSVTKSLLANGSKNINDYTLFGGIAIDQYKTDGSRKIKSDGTKNNVSNDNYSTSFGVKRSGTSLEIKLSKNHAEVNYPGSVDIADFNKDPGADLTSGSNQQKYDVVSKQLILISEITDNTTLQYTLNKENKESIFYSSPHFISEYESTNHRLELKSFMDSAIFQYGLEKNINNVVTTYSDKSRLDKSYFVVGNFDVNNNTTINTGYRKQFFEYPDQAKGDDAQNAYELGVNYKINDHSAIYANYNKAFLIPNFDRLFPSGTFNEEIVPQQSYNYTTGYKYKKQNVSLNAELFFIDLENEIYLDPTIGFFGANRNIDKSHKKGINLSTSRESNGWSYGLAYSYVKAIIDKEAGKDYAGNALPAAPEHTIKLNGSYKFTSSVIPRLPNHKVSIDHKQTSDSYMIGDFNNISEKAPGYKTTNINYKVANKNLGLQIGVNNLFNDNNGLFLYRSTGNKVYATDYERFYYAKLDYSF